MIGPMNVMPSLVRTAPSFLIVGTPRSGTTLIQRLACEIQGVKVPPETDFFARFYPALFRWRFPLEGQALREAVAAYTSTKNVREARLDNDRLIERLNGRAHGPLDMFSAVIMEMAGDGARVYGEKTPKHLLWWSPLTTALPSLRLIALVRDPRAVVASWLTTPWGPSRRRAHVLLADRWRLDQETVVSASTRLGSDRCLVLRYEEVVADPDRARSAIAAFIRAPYGAPVQTPRPEQIFLPRETWKTRATQEITIERINAWERILSPAQARQVEAVCHRGMRAFGYPTTRSSISARAVVASLPPAWNLERMRAALRYRRERGRIAKVHLS